VLYTENMKNDKYSKARGGWSRILRVTCEGCDGHICFYQKDGPGPLKRMYVDRMINLAPSGTEFNCQHCERVLGMQITYKKEKRPAYRLFQDAVKKKIATQKSIKEITSQ